MSKYLTAAKPLLVLPSLANKIGLNEAILLQQIHYWLNKSNNEIGGYRWVYNTYAEWLRQLPFWSEKTLRRTVKKLEDSKLVISTFEFNTRINKTKWYRIDYDRLTCLTGCQPGELITNEPPLVFQPDVAQKYGLNHAIFLQQLHFRLAYSTLLKDEMFWVADKYSLWLDKFSFWSLDVFKRTVRDLTEKKLIYNRNKYNETSTQNIRWFSINYDQINLQQSINNAQISHRPSADYDQTQPNETPAGLDQTQISRRLSADYDQTQPDETPAGFNHTQISRRLSADYDQTQPDETPAGFNHTQISHRLSADYDQTQPDETPAGFDHAVSGFRPDCSNSINTEIKTENKRESERNNITSISNRAAEKRPGYIETQKNAINSTFSKIHNSIHEIEKEFESIGSNEAVEPSETKGKAEVNAEMRPEHKKRLRGRITALKDECIGMKKEVESLASLPEVLKKKLLAFTEECLGVCRDLCLPDAVTDPDSTQPEKEPPREREGTRLRKLLTPEEEAAYRQKIRADFEKGFEQYKDLVNPKAQKRYNQYIHAHILEAHLEFGGNVIDKIFDFVKRSDFLLDYDEVKRFPRFSWLIENADIIFTGKYDTENEKSIYEIAQICAAKDRVCDIINGGTPLPKCRYCQKLKQHKSKPMQKKEKTLEEIATECAALPKCAGKRFGIFREYCNFCPKYERSDSEAMLLKQKADDCYKTCAGMCSPRLMKSGFKDCCSVCVDDTPPPPAKKGKKSKDKQLPPAVVKVDVKDTSTMWAVAYSIVRQNIKKINKLIGDHKPFTVYADEDFVSDAVLTAYNVLYELAVKSCTISMQDVESRMIVMFKSHMLSKQTTPIMRDIINTDDKSACIFNDIDDYQIAAEAEDETPGLPFPEQMVKMLLGILPIRQEQVMLYRLGLTRRGALSLNECALVIGCTKNNIKQSEKSALKSLESFVIKHKITRASGIEYVTKCVRTYQEGKFDLKYDGVFELGRTAG